MSTLLHKPNFNNKRVKSYEKKRNENSHSPKNKKFIDKKKINIKNNNNTIIQNNIKSNNINILNKTKLKNNIIQVFENIQQNNENIFKNNFYSNTIDSKEFNNNKNKFKSSKEKYKNKIKKLPRKSPLPINIKNNKINYLLNKNNVINKSTIIPNNNNNNNNNNILSNSTNNQPSQKQIKNIKSTNKNQPFGSYLHSFNIKVINNEKNKNNENINNNNILINKSQKQSINKNKSHSLNKSPENNKNLKKYKNFNLGSSTSGQSITNISFSSSNNKKQPNIKKVIKNTNKNIKRITNINVSKNKETIISGDLTNDSSKSHSKEKILSKSVDKIKSKSANNVANLNYKKNSVVQKNVNFNKKKNEKKNNNNNIRILSPKNLVYINNNNNNENNFPTCVVQNIIINNNSNKKEKKRSSSSNTESLIKQFEKKNNNHSKNKKNSNNINNIIINKNYLINHNNFNEIHDKNKKENDIKNIQNNFNIVLNNKNNNQIINDENINNINNINNNNKENIKINSKSNKKEEHINNINKENINNENIENNNENIKNNNENIKNNNENIENINILKTNIEKNTLKKQTKTTKKIKDYYTFSHIGFDGEQDKENNQDNFFVYKNFAGKNDYIYMSVCDGHGVEGHNVSEFITKTLPIDLSEKLKSIDFLSEENSENFHEIITETFLITQAKLIDNEKINSIFSGSTCVSVIFTPEKMISANIGDSRAVLGRFNREKNTIEAIELSRDHKPTETDENLRIIEKNGKIEPLIFEGKEFGPKRVWIKNEDYPGLAMTRSFGDRIAQTVGVVSEPEIKEFEFDVNDKFVVIASDGIWEFISSQECVNFVQEFYHKELMKECCEFLYEESKKRWMKNDESVDDITIILIYFED